MGIARENFPASQDRQKTTHCKDVQVDSKKTLLIMRPEFTCSSCNFCSLLLLIYQYIKKNVCRTSILPISLDCFWLQQIPDFKMEQNVILSSGVKTTVQSFYRASKETIYAFVLSSSEFILHVILHSLYFTSYIYSSSWKRGLTQTLALHYILKPGTSANKKTNHPIKHIRSIQCKYNIY